MYLPQSAAVGWILGAENWSIAWLPRILPGSTRIRGELNTFGVRLGHEIERPQVASEKPVRIMGSRRPARETTDKKDGDQSHRPFANTAALSQNENLAPT